MAPTKPAPTSTPEINVCKTKGGRTLFKKPTKKYSTVAGRRPIRKFARGKLFRRYRFDTINSAYSTRVEAIAKETKTKSSALMPVLAKAEEPEAGKEKSESVNFIPECDSKIDLSQYPASQIEVALRNTEHVGRMKIKQEDLDLAGKIRMIMG